LTDFNLYKPGALYIIKRLTGVEVNPKLVNIILALISGDALQFIKNSGELFGIPREAMMDLYQIAMKGNVNSIKSLKWLTQQLGRLFSMPPEVIEAMLLLISGKVDDLDAGRKGMGSTLHTLISFMMEKIPLPN
jgi:hypothetical protein